MPPFNLPLSERGILIAKHQDVFLDVASGSNSGQVNMWPNPCNGNFKISKPADGDYYINVYDITGKKMHYSKMLQGIQKADFNLSLTPGLYFVKMTTTKEQKTLRLMVY